MPIIRYSRPKAAPSETLEQFLVTRFPYGDLSQWRDYIARGYAWIDRPPVRKRNRNTALAQQEPEGQGTEVVATPQCRRIANATETLEQGDMIYFDPPASLEPEVDEENLDILDDDEDWVVCAKNGNIPVAEGGRYIKHTLCRVLSTRVAQFTQRTDEEGGLPPSHPELGVGFRLFPVHRLDKETSGIVVLAKSSAAAALLADQFHHGETSSSTPGASEPPQTGQAERLVASKEYEALLVGVMSHEWWAETVAAKQTAAGDAALTRWGVNVLSSTPGRSGGECGRGLRVAVTARVGTCAEDPCALPSTVAKLRMSCFPVLSPLGKTASTVFHVIRTSVELGITRVRIELHTGRTHQIRVHAALLGFPVLGDKMYCTSTPQVPGGLAAVDDATFLALTRGERVMNTVLPHASHAEGEDVVVATPRRHMLHASRLLIHHPRTKKDHSFASPALPWFEKDIYFSSGERGSRLLRDLFERN